MADRRRGSALLAVLWLSAALAAIAFSLAATVRGELESTATAADGARAYYLATGGLERTLLYMQWGQTYFPPWATRLHFAFPSGEAVVEIVPESAKLNLNSAAPEDLLRLLLALGAPPERAAAIVRAILDWRSPSPGQGLTEFDRYYLALTPSFRSRHASFQEIEELLLVNGMTTELFYGSLQRDPAGRLAPRAGLVDCVSAYGGGGPVDVNTAQPAVLASVGLSPQGVAAILQARQARPFRAPDELRQLGLASELATRLGGGGSGTYTLRSTARLRLADGKFSDLARSVGATVMLGGSGSDGGYQVLRWRDRIWAQDLQ